MAVSKMKLIEVTQAAKEILFDKQRIFEFRNKPNKHLARLLWEKKPGSFLPEFMVSSKGETVSMTNYKLHVIADYYEHDYYTQVLIPPKIEEFLDGIAIPKMQKECVFGLEKPISLQKLKFSNFKFKTRQGTGFRQVNSRILQML